ncbi:MAG: dihydroorotate dehydrogenase [Acidimicrobiia bacterium]
MASGRLMARLGPLQLKTPLIAASGTVGAVWEWAQVASMAPFGAAVAKSVAPEQWPGRPEPRLAPTRVGMLNGIGIQNPGIEAWIEANGPRVSGLDVEVWGSAVAETGEGYALVAKGLGGAGVSAIEVNLSCPNLDGGVMFSFDPDASGEVVDSVRRATALPIGAKLSPDTPDIVATVSACVEAGADFVVLTNTAFGFGISLETRRPSLSVGVGGYSGPGLKPISLRCVYEVHSALPALPIVGCGGVMSGADVAEYLMAGASAVEMGTVLLSDPNAGVRILDQLVGVLNRVGAQGVAELKMAAP